MRESSGSTTAWWRWSCVVLRQGFAKHYGERGEGEVGLRRERGKTLVLAAPKLTTIYRRRGGEGLRPRVPLRGPAAAPDPIWAAARGVTWPPSQVGSPPTLRVSAPMRLGPLGVAHQPTRGWFPRTYSPCGHPGQVAPPGGPPEPFRWSRYTTGVARNNSGYQNLTSYI